MDTSATIPSAVVPTTSPLASLLEAFPGFAALVRRDGKIQQANTLFVSACDSVTGRDLSSFLGDDVAARLIGGGATQPLRAVLHRTSGPDIPTEWSASPGPGQGAIFIGGRDCSRETRLEDYIVSNQCFEVAAAASGGLAHDFNNVLAAILGLAELISMRLPEDSPLQGFATRINSSIDRAKVLVRHFSKFSRKGDGLVEAMPTAMTLQELQLLLDGFLPGNITLDLELSEDTPWCMADRHVFEQIVLNSANFLRTKLRGDGGRILISSRARTNDTTRAFITITGSGGGLVALKLDTIFDLDTTPTTSAYDSGAGLFAARQLAQRAGAELQVRRDDPRTISFLLTLPPAD